MAAGRGLNWLSGQGPTLFLDLEAWRKFFGFDKNGAGNLPFVRYTEAQITNYWQYARNYVLADDLFSTTLGPAFSLESQLKFNRSVIDGTTAFTQWKAAPSSPRSFARKSSHA